MPLQIVNPSPKFPKGTFIEPSPRGYIHIAGDIEAPKAGKFSPVLRKSKEKKDLLARLKELGRALEQVDKVERVTVFQAAMFMPYTKYVEEHTELRRPTFDVVVLVETTSPEDIPQVQESEQYKALMAAFEAKAKSMHVMAARNLRRVGAVDHTRQGLFAFNYFHGADPDVTKELWDYFAGWYQVKAGLTSSELLAPLDGQQSNFVVINHARWRYTMPPRMMSKRSFWTYVRPNLDANDVGLMPVAYRLA